MSKLFVATIAACLMVSACSADKVDPKALHDAQWYLDNSEELSKKLEECKVDPAASANDPNCAAATEAFVRWYQSTSAEAPGPQVSDQDLSPPVDSVPPEQSAQPVDAGVSDQVISDSDQPVVNKP